MKEDRAYHEVAAKEYSSAEPKAREATLIERLERLELRVAKADANIESLDERSGSGSRRLDELERQTGLLPS